MPQICHERASSRGSTTCFRALFEHKLIILVFVCALNRMKDKGYDISHKGVSIKTTRRFDRQDYIDATQRYVCLTPLRTLCSNIPNTRYSPVAAFHRHLLSRHLKHSADHFLIHLAVSQKYDENDDGHIIQPSCRFARRQRIFANSKFWKFGKSFTCQFGNFVELRCETWDGACALEYE